jgi:hypothetical protein
MFLLNSRLGLLAAASGSSPGQKAGSPPEALLLPKLRSYFAEFLNEGSLDHLRVLTPTYQCRFAVRAPSALATRLFLPA